MKRIKLTILFGLTIFSTSIFAQTYGTSSNYGGNTTYHNLDNGLTGTSTNYGGNTTYHNLNGVSGTSTNYGGNTTYLNLDW